MHEVRCQVALHPATLNSAESNSRSYTVIGVAPPGFDGTEVIATPEMWFPMAMQAQIDIGSNWLSDRDSEYIFVQGRLKSAVSPVQASGRRRCGSHRTARIHGAVGLLHSGAACGQGGPDDCA
jgi:hypothetical protein